jgi:F-type H+-transporting ATPase subunit gamma
MALKHIKNKIKATDRTRKVTKAMEAVSAVKMRKSQERALGNRGYAEAALRILANVYSIADIQKSAYLTKTGPRECLVIITSDKGLAGSLNSAVLKLVDRYAEGKDPSSIVALCLGRKGYEHALRKGFDVAYHAVNVRDEVSLEDLAIVAEKAIRFFNTGDVAKLSVVFQNFVSTFLQEPAVRQLLPLKRDVITEMIQSIIPKTGKYSGEAIDGGSRSYELEPSGDAVFSVLVPQLVHILLYHALLETKASEHSARMVAMKNASDNAKEVSKRLTLKFNKARQAAITREVSEITGGMEAMKGSN